jgi:hypothetical protein
VVISRAEGISCVTYRIGEADISCARKAQLQHIKVKKAECGYFRYQNQLPTKCRQLIFSFVNPE